MRLLGGTASHVGNVREANQDRVYFGGQVAALADGMGGHQGGERAAELAIGQFKRAGGQLSETDLVDMVLAANRAVHGHASENGLPGMGTTLVALTLHGDGTMTVANVGDSRAYWIRGDYMNQITEDHSFVEDLVRQGRLTHEEAAIHPQRNILTRAIGIGVEVEVDRFPIEEPAVGDRFLLCSDGLFNELSEDRILEIVLQSPDPVSAAERLIEATLETPCRDNVTVAVVEVVDDDDPRATAADSDDVDDGVITDEFVDDANAITAQVPVVQGAVLQSVGDAGGSGRPTRPDDPTVSPADVGTDLADDLANDIGASNGHHAGVSLAEETSPNGLEVDDPEIDRTTSEMPIIGDELVEVRPRSRLILAIGSLALAAGLVAGGYFLARGYARSGYFIDTDPSTGTLAVFQGREGGLFGLFEPIAVTPTDHVPEVLAEVDMVTEADGRFDERGDAEAVLATVESRLVAAEQERAAAEEVPAGGPSDGTADAGAEDGSSSEGN